MADDPNSPAARQQMMRTVYYRHPDPAKGVPVSVQMYAIDAQNAVGRFPDDYSFEPWTDDDTDTPARAVTRAGGGRIPPNWRDLSTAERRAVAAGLGAPPEALPHEADQVIADEEKRRAGLQEAQAEAEADLEQQARDAARRPGTAPADAGAVEIPEDWHDRNWPERRALALKLGAPQNVKADEADNLIANELKRRNTTKPGDKLSPEPGQPVGT
jgi:hypothetical protein